MKNKEIEELLNELKDKYSYEPYDNTGEVYTTISYEEGQLLLSHIEQLEKRNKQLYEGFMATQEELTDYATKNEQLENNRDKAIEVIDLITPELWNISNAMTYKLKDIKIILKGDSDESR